MRQALQDGDMTRLTDCLQQVAGHDAALALALQGLAADFEVEHLLRLLHDDAP
jgi:hypothetical protein